MPVEIKIDDSKLRSVAQKFPSLAAKHVGLMLTDFMRETQLRFTRERLSAPDDRQAGDFLHRRPRSSQGLVRRTGRMAGDLQHKVTKAPRLEDVEARIGWPTGRQARIAKVHEFGRRIVGPMAIPVRALGAAFGAVQRIVKVKAVTIPPRLGFFDFFRSDETQKLLRRGFIGAVRVILADARKAGRR